LLGNDSDQLKERGSSQDLLAEPVNTLSNIAFFAAMLMTMPFVKSWFDGMLSAGIAMVGLGSTLYHVRPCRMTRLIDAVTIIAWVMLYVFGWAHFMLKVSTLSAVALVITFIGINYLFNKKYGRTLNGSADYLPVIGLLLVSGSSVWYLYGHPHLVIAGILAATSLVFRVVDNDVRMPAGTHFIWHIMNGFMMAMLTLYVSVHVEV